MVRVIPDMEFDAQTPYHLITFRFHFHPLEPLEFQVKAIAYVGFLGVTKTVAISLYLQFLFCHQVSTTGQRFCP
jgi:hypothetical protein